MVTWISSLTLFALSLSCLHFRPSPVSPTGLTLTSLRAWPLVLIDQHNQHITKYPSTAPPSLLSMHSFARQISPHQQQQPVEANVDHWLLTNDSVRGTCTFSLDIRVAPSSAAATATNEDTVKTTCNYFVPPSDLYSNAALHAEWYTQFKALVNSFHLSVTFCYLKWQLFASTHRVDAVINARWESSSSSWSGQSETSCVSSVFMSLILSLKDIFRIRMNVKSCEKVTGWSEFSSGKERKSRNTFDFSSFAKCPWGDFRIFLV